MPGLTDTLQLPGVTSYLAGPFMDPEGVLGGGGLDHLCLHSEEFLFMTYSLTPFPHPMLNDYSQGQLPSLNNASP